MVKDFDAVIVGAGLVGMSMALSLAKTGLKIAVIERTKISSQLDAEFDGRVSAIALGSQYILDDIGAWEFMQPYAEPILDIRVSDGATPFFLHYDHKEVGKNPFGYIIENRYTRYALHQAAALLPNITLIENFKIKTLFQNQYNASITRDNGESITASLIIAADGKNSQIRELAGIKATHWDYKQTAIVCTIEHSLAHNGLAQERFLPIGPFAVLPMTGNRSSLVWVEPNDRVKIYMDLPEDEFVQEITERIGGYLGDIRTSGKRFSYPLSMLHAKKYSAQRIAFIGDAAHSIHPIAGQGVNLGFRDVATLGELIRKQYKCGLDIGAENILSDYEKLRAVDNLSMIAITDLLNRLFSNNILPIRTARDIGLWTVGKLPVVKRIFMHHAMGIKKAGNA